MTLKTVVNCTITDHDIFNKQAARATETSLATPGCSQYEWYVNGDQCIILESYDNDAAFFAHLEAVGPILGELMEGCTLDAINVITPASDAVKEATKDFPTNFFTRLENTVAV